jgi:Uma2 family endonuclease
VTAAGLRAVERPEADLRGAPGRDTETDIMRVVDILAARPPKTEADYLALPDNIRAELIEGELYLTPAPVPDHQTVALRIANRILEHAGRVSGGGVWVGPVDVHLPGGNIVQPDVLWIASDRRGIVGERVDGPPDLAVEVVSPTHPERDRIVKRRLYARAGVREYWIVDPEARGIEVLSLAGDDWRPAGWFTAGTTLVSPLLPELRLAVDEVFRDPWADPRPPAAR